MADTEMEEIEPFRCGHQVPLINNEFVSLAMTPIVWDGVLFEFVEIKKGITKSIEIDTISAILFLSGERDLYFDDGSDLVGWFYLRIMMCNECWMVRLPTAKAVYTGAIDHLIPKLFANSRSVCLESVGCVS